MEHKPTQKTDPTPTLPTAEQQLFVGTIVSITWQLLIVVTVPFIGGNYLDERNGTTPLWTLVGLGLALTMAALVTWRGYKTISEKIK